MRTSPDADGMEEGSRECGMSLLLVTFGDGDASRALIQMRFQKPLPRSCSCPFTLTILRRFCASLQSHERYTTWPETFHQSAADGGTLFPRFEMAFDLLRHKTAAPRV
jgi:hypothetical protein